MQIENLIQRMEDEHPTQQKLNEENRDRLAKLLAGLMQIFTYDFLMKTEISVLADLVIIHDMVKHPMDEIITSALMDNMIQGTLCTLRESIVKAVTHRQSETLQ